MRRTLDIAINDLRIIFKDRSIWINLIILPIVLSVAVGFANGVGSSAPSGDVKIIIDVLDNDQSTASSQFLDDLRAANGSLLLCPMDQTADDACQYKDGSLTPELAQTRLENKVSLATIELPSGFGASIGAGQRVDILYRSNESATAPSYILQAVQSAATRLNGAQVAAQVGEQVAGSLPFLQFSDDADRQAFVESIRQKAQEEWAANPVSVQTVEASLSENTSSNNNGNGFAQSIPGIASMYVMFVVLPAAAAIILERKNWTLQRLATMPVSRTQILGGKLLARFVLGMIQYFILFAFGGVVVGVRFGNDPVALILLMITYSACVTALSLALTTFITTDQQAQGIALFMSLTLAPLGGAWWPLEIVPAWMRVVGHISPIAWAMDGYHEIIFYGGGLGDVIVPILVLVALTAALFAFGVSRFRFTN